MHKQDTIFKEELITGYLNKFSEEQIKDFDSKWKRIQKWKYSCEKGDLTKTKETSIQGLFLNQIFGEILGYTTVIDGGIYNQIQEFNSTLDGSEADGALGFFNVQEKIRDVRVAIELKGADVPLDKKQNRSSHLTPVEQGMSYANKNGSKCGWVIVSNFIETRLYKSDSSLEYETFDIRKMDDKKEFLRFYFLLCREHLICDTSKSLIDRLYQENEEIGVRISNDFYREYKEIRTCLYQHLQDNNPDRDEISLFTKSQKIMDRFTFICFCEDCGLLPANTYRQLIDAAEHSFSFSNTKLWDQLRGLFVSIDKGNPPMKINRYNGGLFKEDPELDTLVIEDDILKSFMKLADYNFSSDLNVNILGQIFEQSISDVEQIKNEILGVETDSVGKQKEDGIFYTPYYVTRYIVENTVGAYLNDKKEEIKQTLFTNGGFKAQVIKKSTGRSNTHIITRWEEVPELQENPTDEDTMHYDAVSKLHLAFWTEYENVLKTIKICDPSCGSGAFLNQCFDFLKEEMDFVLDMKRQFNAQLTLFDIDKEILQNNLYGVDINQESVEITKLSLWLKTAKSNQTLASLDDNIKCGNSIVDAPEVAGDLAFNWEDAFPEVFKNGGFDVVVGNPPYGAKLDSASKKHIKKHYKTSEGRFDSYHTFIELGFNILRDGGYIGYITPNTYLILEQGTVKLRHFIFDNYTAVNFVELYNVFPNAVVEPIISVFYKGKRNDDFTVISIPRRTTLTSTFINDGVVTVFNQSELSSKEGYVFNYKENDKDKYIKSKIRKGSLEVQNIFRVAQGVIPYGKGEGNPPQTEQTIKEKPFTKFEQEDDTWVPYYKGRNFNRYIESWGGEYIKYGEWLCRPRSIDIWKSPKLFVRQTGDYPVATYIDGFKVAKDSVHTITNYPDSEGVDLKFLLALLNSKMMKWIFQNDNFHIVGKPLAQTKAIYIKRLPVRIERQSDIIPIVDKLLDINAEKRSTANKFIRYLQKMYSLQKVSDNLREFYLFDFKMLVEELRKQKVKLSAKEKIDLMEVFEEYQKVIAQKNTLITSFESLIDTIVYELD